MTDGEDARRAPSSYVIVGAGAIGCAVAAVLLDAGASVTLVARGPRLEALQQGLTVRRPAGAHVVRPTVVSSPSQVRLGPETSLILAVKSQDTPTVLAQWAAATVHGADGKRVGTAQELVPVICFQSGLENERLAARRFTAVVGAAVWISAYMQDLKTVVLPGAQKIGAVDLGAFPRGSDARCDELRQRLEAGEVVTRCSTDIMRLKAYKLVSSVRNAVPALLPAGHGSEALADQAAAEAITVLAASGADMTDCEAELRRAQALACRGTVEGTETPGNSTVQSLVAGASVETDYLNGEVVLLGKLTGIATPVNRWLQLLMAESVARSAAPGAADPAWLTGTTRSLVEAGESAESPFTAGRASATQRG